MTSTKSKKKPKTAMIPKPIKIKKEDDHVMYPMEHYVDDRVELIRQIFASLKPKTITNLAPDFLKKSKLEDIQEQCLNEVLGISKKRLISIINSTKCPTDTDTSGEEDIHSVEEHISLEEISSDSDIADHKTAKAPKENDKQFSVLELLELQARARAIRSQLALEPVTKIEVDTDSDDEKPLPKSKSEGVSTSRQKTVNVSNGGATSSRSDPSKRSATASKPISKPNTEAAQSAPTKRIKLKRNFRKQVQNDDSNDDEKRNEETSKPVPQPEPKKERSPSPDVIPIIPVPETLCISDSDDEQPPRKNSVKEVEVTKVPEPTKPIEILSVVEITPANNSVTQTSSVHQSDEPKAEAEKVPIEPEEGEILDDDDKTLEPLLPEPSITKENEDEVVPTEKASEEIECKEEPMNEVEKEQKKVAMNCEEPQRVDNSDSEDDSNDDVISLEGGDLVNEMKEHLDDETEEPSKETKTEDVICLDDSSDEEIKHKKKTESWNERWLKSSKVSKVLAASRLGNRVRNKIKESKKAKKLEEAAETELEQKKSQEYVFTSKHEDGSVEQYKEIQETIQRKAE